MIQQAVFTKGTQVGELAQQLFPGGIDSSPASFYKYREAIVKTDDLIVDGEKIIYEACFQHDEVMCALDILVNKNGKWYAYEVKSSTGISETHIRDAALQYHVIQNSGTELEDFFIVHINTEYTRDGQVDLSQLFNIVSVKKEVLEQQEMIGKQIPVLMNVIEQEQTPEVKIGLHCTSPYHCNFIGHCWSHLPERSVFDIKGLHADKKFELHDNGIIDIMDVPDDYKLTDRQRLQISSYKNGKSTIDKKGITEFLSTLKYPLYFVDFETFQPAIPLYDHSRPYQQIPFQYSLHYKKDKDSKIEHYEYLAETGIDPRIGFIQSLLEHTRTAGDIMVYSPFEATRIKELIADFPQENKSLEKLLGRLRDLMIPFQKNYYYTPEMDGSHSIKSVLPALVPDMNYKNLNIADGISASYNFENLTAEADLFKVEQTRQDLLEYCKMDTLAMVKILEVLENV